MIRPNPQPHEHTVEAGPGQQALDEPRDQPPYYKRNAHHERSRKNVGYRAEDRVEHIAGRRRDGV